MTAGVSVGILDLAEAGRLSATSVMVNRPHLPDYSRQLSALAQKLDIGLHLNLTLGAPLERMPGIAPSGSFPSIGAITSAALRGNFDRAEVKREIESQLSRFEDEFQRAPDFVDGHQHVHALPRIRTLLVDTISIRYGKAKPYLRDPSDKLAAISRRGVAVRKALMVGALAKGLRTLAAHHHIQTNDGFAGFSPFDPGRSYSDDFNSYLIKPGRRHLIMCHPGRVDDELRALDPVVDTRPQELSFMLSDRFGDMLASGRWQMVRYQDFGAL